ncbi:hypothetical protein [Pedobacter sp. SYSU D00535]|uniref:hypothetical protein n=1 Tax=Pedobacter sp. SYSU D00535 TaxID=2810308 RepID=UPI001A95C369|nr:hypothetical protein [Pedobacter sp. SYSU D00535]
MKGIATIIKKSYLAIALSCITLACVAISAEVFKSEKGEARLPKKAGRSLKSETDEQLLSKMERVCSMLDINRPECFVEGSVSSYTQGNTLDVEGTLPYIYSKRGNDFYYKLGQTETINAKGLYIYIDPDAKKVLLSDQKVLTDSSPNAIHELFKQILEDRFAVRTKFEGDNQVITLLNEMHLSCKEYSVSFDTLSLKPNRVFCRMPNSNAAGSTGGDLVLDMRLQTVSSISQIEKFVSKPVIIRDDNKWTLSKEFQGYELVIM